MSDLFPLQPEHFYRSPEFSIVLFPILNEAQQSAATTFVMGPIAGARGGPPYLSFSEDDQRIFLEPNEIFLVLEVNRQCVKVLCTSNGRIGWFLYKEWLKIERVMK